MNFFISILTTMSLLAGSAESRPAQLPALKTVSSVDLNRYAGTWYEIARYPAKFQKKCVRDVRATYTLRSDGKVEVLNQCVQADGKIKTAKGKAKIVDRTTNAKLKVTFFWPFYGDYWILELDPEYKYAVVGEPKRKYLWILSRSPEMDPAVYDGILERLKTIGYDPSKLMKTSQSLATDKHR
jgi:apolipoprotein D and lipocalin family protein